MKYYKFKMKILVLNILAFVLMIFSLVGYFFLFNDYYISPMFLVYFILWMFLHEIIHGLSFWVFKDVDKKNITFGAKLESGIFYCMCKQPISKRVILVSLVAPLFFIGIVTLIISIIFNWKILGLLSLFNISGSIGDLVMIIMFLQLPNEIKYTDLDDCESFVLISEEDLSKKKYFCMNLIEQGFYTNKIMPIKYKRIECSTISMIMFIITIILFIISLF